MIDAHHHLWDLTAREHSLARWAASRGRAMDELARLRRLFGLDGPGSAGGGVRRDWHRGGPDRSRALGDAGPAGAGRRRRAAGRRWWAGRDLAAPLGDRTRALPAAAGRAGRSCDGVRHPVLVEPDPDWLARPVCCVAWTRWKRLGLCFDAWRGRISRGRGRRGSFGARADVRARPSGRPPGWRRAGPWAVAISELGAAERGCKLSGHTQPARAATCVRDLRDRAGRFGPGRLMFGCGWPVSSLAATYGEICDLYLELTADLSAAERERHLRRYRPPRLQPRAVTSRGRRSAGRRAGSPG